MAIITGTSGFDRLFGTSGQDSLQGLGGPDVLLSHPAANFNPDLYTHYANRTEAQGAIWRLYQVVVGRDPDERGMNYWTGQLTNRFGEPSQTLNDAAAGFVGSSEFNRKFGALDDRAFIETLYQNAFGRAPDAGLLDSWTADLALPDVSRADIALRLSESPEMVLREMPNSLALSKAADEIARLETVFRAFDGLLNRPVDAQGIVAWANNGWWDNTAQLVGEMMDSYEFGTVIGLWSDFDGWFETPSPRGGAVDADFVSLMYSTVLDRAGSTAEIDGWVTRAADLGLDRANVAARFIDSAEHRANTALDYIVHLQRMGGDTLDGGAGANLLQGGPTSDTFVFRATDTGRHTVVTLQQADYLRFEGFGYDTREQVVALFQQSGEDAVLDDQGTVVILNDFDVADLRIWMIDLV